MNITSKTQLIASRSVANSLHGPEAATAGLANSIRNLQGPILVVGAHGFVGSNLLKTLLHFRQDVYGTKASSSSWRLADMVSGNVRCLELQSASDLRQLLDELRPRTVINCIACEVDVATTSELLYSERFLFTQRLLTALETRDIQCYVHVVCSSAENMQAQGYPVIGTSSSQVTSNEVPDHDYSVADAAASNLVRFYGVRKQFPCAVVRLGTTYGPLLDLDNSSNPIVAYLETNYGDEESATDATANPPISDTLYIDDACAALVAVADGIEARHYGWAFSVTAFPGDADKASSILAEFFWRPSVTFEAGISYTVDWLKSIGGFAGWRQLAYGTPAIDKRSISAIVACYNEALSIPVMYQRLRDTFVRLGIDYEIIFVNNGSKDNSEDLIRSLSAEDSNVIGVTHSRSFGAETTYRSGLELASKQACVLLDGDLQDPPEMIEQFVEKWRDGYDVVYGRRVKREAPIYMQFSYKLFYKLFSYFSYIPIPQDAGDFSLIDTKVVHYMLQFKERDLWLRGIRAYVGFKQIGVDYVRPERMFGKTSNNMLKNIGWAKKGIFSFTRMPLDALSNLSVVMVFVSVLLGALQVTARLLFPNSAAWGITTVLVTILFFGSINLFAISLIGEYIAKIFDEVKGRPLYIRRSIIQGGEIKPVSDVLPGKEFS